MRGGPRRRLRSPAGGRDRGTGAGPWCAPRSRGCSGQPDVPLGQGRSSRDGLRLRARAHVSTLSIRSPRHIVHYLETRAAWSSYDATDDLVTVTFSSQGVQIPHRLMCERVLDLPKEKAASRHGGCWRRLRSQISDIGGIDPDRLGHAKTPPRPALDLRARRAFPGRQSCARPRCHGGTGAGCGRTLHRPAREGRGELRRLCLDVRADDSDHGPRQGDFGPLSHSRDPRRFRLRLHQHRASRCHPRCGQARGALPAGASRRPGGARDRPLAGRV